MNTVLAWLSALLWLPIVLWGLPRLWRIIATGGTGSGDLIPAALGLVGIGTVLRGLWLVGWANSALLETGSLALSLSALGIMITRAMHPDHREHARSIMLAHAVIVIGCLCIALALGGN